ncbi:MAG: UvrD-helicase domain-containing protein [Cyclobacteriaceae bacterium]|nr:UvrD-helicase domain-containing protein [Cyclobacteriaceae bacterium]
MTFTNKATQEMKDRVLAYLGAFSGKNDKPWPDAEHLAADLKAELGLDDLAFRQNSNELLTLILHQYDQFSISTIDAFFQRVIRAFTRESGLIGDYRLEVDQEAVLTEVVNNLIDELKESQELTDWVVRFAQESMESDKTWDIRKRLVEFSQEIFRDEFKLIEEEVYERTGSPKFFAELQTELYKVKSAFASKVSKPAKEILSIMQAKGWDVSYFKYGKGSGLESYLNNFVNASELKSLEIKPRMRNDFLVARNWPGKDYPLLAKEIMAVAEKEFIPRITFINETFDAEYTRALSAELALQNFYVFGLMADIGRKLNEYKGEHNVMLLADAPKFLHHIIGESDTPFVYEKVGSFYRNYLIDEFQDTSGFQWKNFLPLLTNSLDQGYPSMVVGDVKQAIYRWRGGDLNLLEHQLEKDIGKMRVEVKELADNFRSTREVVHFNNLVFASASRLASAKISSELPSDVYRDVRQSARREIAGFVRVRFLKDNEEQKWKAQSLATLAKDVERLQMQGVAPGEIAILVRANSEGQDIAAHLLDYKFSSEAKKGVSYEVVSNESLRIDGASTVNLLLAALRHLVNADDPIARAQLSYEYTRLHQPKRPRSEIFDVTNQVFFESHLPESFTKHKLSLKKLPLFELTETLIGLFDLGREKGELAYLQAFQDIVLDFYTRERNDLASFLLWWEENKNTDKTSIKLSGEVNAINILTIHKAKGLQFKYVLIPFCSWNVDHEGFKPPNLWVSSEHEPYAHAGPMPVKYGKALEQSYFSSAYSEERIKVYLDNLNVLYVALTRAEVGMIITAPAPKTYGHSTSVAAWLYDSIQQQDDLNAAWSEAAMELEIGELKVDKEASPTSTSAPLQLTAYRTDRWREKLVIRQSGNHFFEGMNPETRERISYGIYLHAVLSRIRTRDDIHPVLTRLVQEGVMTAEERHGLATQLEELMTNPLVGKWFENSWDVRTEVPILLPGGATNRIDRLMLDGKKAVVVDFKTGEKSKTDQQQVADYLDILKQMGFTEVEGYLLYTRDAEIIPVGGAKPKPVKGKNKNQLGLDF